METLLCGCIHLLCPYSCFRDFCTQLYRRAHRLCLWSASVFHGHCPPDLTTIVLTEPLRSPPSVTQVVEGSKYINQKCDVYGYSPPSSPPAADGPDPLLVIHKGEGHTGVDPRDCEQCGSQVGRVLLEVLHIGQSGEREREGESVFRCVYEREFGESVCVFLSVFLSVSVCADCVGVSVVCMSVHKLAVR